MERLLQPLSAAREVARKAGPYLLIEILMPGGTLIVLALLLLRGTPAAGPANRALRRMRVATLRLVRDWPGYVGATGLSVPRRRDGLEPLGLAA